MVIKSTNDSRYQIVVTNPYGKTIQVIDEFNSVDYARKVNDVGELSLVVEDRYPSWVLVPENRIEVWRKRSGVAKLDMNATWFIQSTVRTIAGTSKFMEVSAHDQIGLLKRRVIPYNEGNPTTEKQDLGDDVLKAIMRENFGALAYDTERDLSAYLTIQADAGLAPQVTVFCAKDNVFDVAKDIVDACYTGGTFMAYDFAYMPDNGKFEFRTYVGQRGIDRSVSAGSKATIIGIEQGSIAEIKFYDDRTEEYNFIYCGAKDLVGIEPPKEAKNEQSIGLSPFNRKEFHETSSSSDDPGELQTQANSTLQAKRATKRVEATLSTEFALTEYGDKFDYGDIITLSFDGKMYNMFVNAISVKIDQNGESIEVVLTDVNE